MRRPSYHEGSARLTPTRDRRPYFFLGALLGGVVGRLVDAGRTPVEAEAAGALVATEAVSVPEAGWAALAAAAVFFASPGPCVTAPMMPRMVPTPKSEAATMSAILALCMAWPR